jgi:AraC family transcriptional regulator
MRVEYKDMPALRVAAVRHQGPYHQISEAFARLGQVAATAGLQDAPGTMVAVYHDDPADTPVAELHSEAGLVLRDDTALPPGLIELRLPAGRYAVTTYVGPYQFLGEAWANLREEVAASGTRSPQKAAAYEIYRNTPETSPAAKLITELYLPVPATTSPTPGQNARA